MGLQNKEDKIIELLKDISSKLDIIIKQRQPIYQHPTVYGPILNNWTEIK